MLIPFPALIKQHQIRPIGVLHIGASTGQEAQSYYDCGVQKTVFVEAIPEIYNRLVKNVAEFPNAIAIQACITDQDDHVVPFNISSNNGESSSLFEFQLHKVYHSDVTFVGKIYLRSQRMDSLIERYDINMAEFDFLNIDLQGAELMALKGLGKYLQQIKYAYIEVNEAPLYKDIPLIDEVETYLKSFGLLRKDIKMTDKHWGDAFYMRH